MWMDGLWVEGCRVGDRVLGLWVDVGLVDGRNDGVMVVNFMVGFVVGGEDCCVFIAPVPSAPALLVVVPLPLPPPTPLPPPPPLVLPPLLLPEATTGASVGATVGDSQ